MIDLRCHILDVTGCGPETFEESLEMCRLAAHEGASALVAAARWPSHAVREGRTSETALLEKCERRLARLRSAAPDNLKLIQGFVLAFSEDLPAQVEKHGAQLSIGGGRSLLITLPALDLPESVEEVWAKLGRMGYEIIVARPECSPTLRRDHRRLARWVERHGALLQMDAASVTGGHGREAQRFAFKLLETYASRSRVLVASNARDAGERRPSLRAAMEEVRRKIGSERARQIAQELPARIVGLEEDPAPRSAVSRAWATTLLRPFAAKFLPEKS